jgi:Fur family peroxide stress response transcriptional regulator
MKIDQLRNLLSEKDLKVTPQRLIVLDAIFNLNNHPTADIIIQFVQKKNPNIAVGTIYNILDTLVEQGIISRVKTDRDKMRYDPILTNHHHLYCYESDRIEDYFDEELNELLEDYFSRKTIPGFNIRDVKLQILGNFNK